MWRRNMTTQYFSLSNYSNTNLSLRTELTQRKHLIYKLKLKIKNKTYLNLKKWTYNITHMNLDIIHDKLSVVGKIYF
jgi:hypothetical protein